MIESHRFYKLEIESPYIRKQSEFPEVEVGKIEKVSLN